MIAPRLVLLKPETTVDNVPPVGSVVNTRFRFFCEMSKTVFQQPFPDSRYSSFVPQWARKGDLANEPELYWHGQAPDDTEDNHMTEPTLLPCPFAKCGGRAVLYGPEDDPWVECGTCGLSIWLPLSRREEYPSANDAFDFWNDRTAVQSVWQTHKTAPRDESELILLPIGTAPAGPVCIGSRPLIVKWHADANGWVTVDFDLVFTPDDLFYWIPNPSFPVSK